MAEVLALIPTDLDRGFLGLPSRLAETLGDRSVLAQTVRRAARIRQVKRVVLVCPVGQEPLALLGEAEVDKPVEVFRTAAAGDDRYRAMRTSAWKWALGSWRGGLGGMTCYDALLPAKPLREAMEEYGAASAILIGADWPVVDPKLCENLLDLHLKHGAAMQIVFNQAPPGLSGIVVGTDLLDRLIESPSGGFGSLMAYQPSRPQADPVGKDVCVQIPPAVRNRAQRFVYDTAEAAARVAAIVDQLGSGMADADASEIVGAADTCLDDEGLPPQVTLELTARRLVNGPIVAQHHVALERADMSVGAAVEIVRQLGARGDLALTLGGLGDALLHAHCAEIVTAAHEAGVMGIAIETDLLVDEAALDALLAMPIDVVSVRLNADTAGVYERAMGVDRFGEVMSNMERLINHRNRQAQDGHRPVGVPWIVPRLIKTAETLPDMERFFDRWVHFTGHAVIDPATTGRGPDGDLMPAGSPVMMAPPKRLACRQLERRMSIHADGRVALCDQDWLCRDDAPDVTRVSVADAWRSLAPTRDAHGDGRWHELPLCAGCAEWHRP